MLEKATDTYICACDQNFVRFELTMILPSLNSCSFWAVIVEEGIPPLTGLDMRKASYTLSKISWRADGDSKTSKYQPFSSFRKKRLGDAAKKSSKTFSERPFFFPFGALSYMGLYFATNSRNLKQPKEVSETVSLCLKDARKSFIFLDTMSWTTLTFDFPDESVSNTTKIHKPPGLT